MNAKRVPSLPCGAVFSRLVPHASISAACKPGDRFISPSLIPSTSCQMALCPALPARSFSLSTKAANGLQNRSPRSNTKLSKSPCRRVMISLSSLFRKTFSANLATMYSDTHRLQIEVSEGRRLPSRSNSLQVFIFIAQENIWSFPPLMFFMYPTKRKIRFQIDRRVHPSERLNGLLCRSPKASTMCI